MVRLDDSANSRGGRMNEKIKELIEQATSTHTHLSPGGTFEETTRYFNEEKFAELIINECIMICKSHKIQSTEDVRYLAHNETVNDISENIEEYFGVEE
jgi:tartrate dehydratase beta subunit/fumarate hydratase class I family protein